VAKPRHKHPRTEFEGRNYYRDPRTGYYYHTITATAKKTILHRDVYTSAHGPVPKEFDIHHIDFNKENNAPDNLVAMSRSDHRKLHANHKDERWIGSEANKVQLRAAGELAKAWHSSPEGLEWHSANGKKAWDNRIAVAAICQQCDKPYKTYYPSRSKFCHNNCKAAALRARRKKEAS
jgi:hypothetical protein